MMSNETPEKVLSSKKKFRNLDIIEPPKLVKIPVEQLIHDLSNIKDDLFDLKKEIRHIYRIIEGLFVYLSFIGFILALIYLI